MTNDHPCSLGRLDALVWNRIAHHLDADDLARLSCVSRDVKTALAQRRRRDARFVDFMETRSPDEGVVIRRTLLRAPARPWDSVAAMAAESGTDREALRIAQGRMWRNLPRFVAADRDRGS